MATRGGIEFKDNKRLMGPQIEFFFEKEPIGNPISHPDNFLEIGNIIFIKYFIDQKTFKIYPLINPGVESVVGLERIVAATENKNIFPDSSNPNQKIINDHTKSLLFIFAEESIKPGYHGRGRIIKTLIRNILTSCYLEKIKPSEIISKISDQIIAHYHEIYPEIASAKQTVIETIVEDETKFQNNITKAKIETKSYQDKNNSRVIDEKEIKFLKERFGIPEKLIPTLV